MLNLLTASSAPLLLDIRSCFSSFPVFTGCFFDTLGKVLAASTKSLAEGGAGPSFETDNFLLAFLALSFTMLIPEVDDAAAVVDPDS